ncbi:hypothetical protein GCM10009787_65180 [Streptomyces bangladeshensis]|uniref:Uncharacterized protein n=1 Tax=Streptomyces bangladeshensis TaxID=295352 RepID=A0ABP5NYF1_9ACTN
MDKNRLVEIVRAAAESGVCDSRLLDRLTETISINVGSVSRDNLLQIYRRRLKRTVDGSRLQDETMSLLSFLEEYQQDTLTMASVSLGGGGSELFLLDSEGENILHWMRMFSR